MTGVHRPASRERPPAAAAKSGKVPIDSERVPERSRTANQVKDSPRQRRRRNRPTPGQPLGNVEYRRCRQEPNLMVLSSRYLSTRLRGILGVTLLGDALVLKVNNSALQSDRYRVGAVVRSELGHDMSDVTLHSFFGER